MSNAISHFVDLLDNWGYHYPLPSQWAVEIPMPSGISGALESRIQELEHPEWEINSALSELTKSEVLTKEGVHCFFVDGADLISENAGVTSTSIGEGGNINGGLIPGLYSTGRADFSQRALKITFRETAYSFADFVIRPWIILSAHLGRIADKNNEIKTNITVYSYGKSLSPGGKPTIRKIYRYYGCVPAKVSELALKYDDSSIMTYSTEWYFDRYSISTRKGALATSSPTGTNQRPTDAITSAEEGGSLGATEYNRGGLPESAEARAAREADSAAGVAELRKEITWLKPK